MVVSAYYILCNTQNLGQISGISGRILKQTGKLSMYPTHNHRRWVIVTKWDPAPLPTEPNEYSPGPGVCRSHRYTPFHTMIGRRADYGTSTTTSLTTGFPMPLDPQPDESQSIVWKSQALAWLQPAWIGEIQRRYQLNQRNIPLARELVGWLVTLSRTKQCDNLINTSYFDPLVIWDNLR